MHHRAPLDDSHQDRVFATLCRCDGRQNPHHTDTAEEAQDLQKVEGAPEEVPHYKDSWSIGDRYNKPLDWANQNYEYERKVQWYDKDKLAYDAFFEQKLRDIKESEEQASKRDKDRKEAKRRKKLNEKLLAGDRFLKFASKWHPDHPVYANYISKKLKAQNHKQQKKNVTPEGKHNFNSPTPKDKENIRK
jgi:hypothetical protein